jgi:hypothetical protein
MAVSLGETVSMRMLRSYGRYRTGQIVPVTGGLARTLELTRYAVRVTAEPAFEFAVAPEPATERAVAPIAKAKRGRPKRA